MIIKEGDQVKSDLDGRDYIVTKIEGGLVTLS